MLSLLDELALFLDMFVMHKIFPSPKLEVRGQGEPTLTLPPLES
jgi:hypothetical protein